MPEQDCPVCVTDESVRDVQETGDTAADTFGSDGFVTDSTDDAACPDAGTDITDVTDIFDGDAVGDLLPADVPNDATDAPDAPDTFFTGMGVVKGRAYFTNMDDQSGFLVQLVFGEHDDWGNDNPPVATVVTGADGYFEFHGLPGGSYDLGIDYESWTSPGEYWWQFDIWGNQTVQAGEVAFTAYGVIKGMVIYPDGYNGDFGVAYESGRDRYTYIYSDGEFAFYGLLPGTYQICLGFDGLVGRCFDDVAVEGLKITDLGEIEAPLWDPATGPGVNVSGNVKMFHESDNSGIEVIYDPGPSQVTATTDAAGDYSFENVRPGVVEIRFSSPEGSGFERNSASMEYPLYAGTSAVLPSQTLVRGTSVWDSDASVLWPLQAEFSPDSRYLVYAVTEADSVESYPVYPRNLYTLDLETGVQTWLADSISGFLIRPDSSEVIFWTDGGPNWLFSVPIGGGQLKIVTTREAWNRMLSPDSRFVVHSEFGNYEPRQTFATDLDTGAEHNVCQRTPSLITEDSRTLFCHGNYRLEIVRLEDGSPVYASEHADAYMLSPDSMTAFVCQSNMTADFVDVETGAVSSLEVPAGSCRAALWLPDSSGIVYISMLEQLVVARIDGSPPIILDEGKTRPVRATPDSTKVVYFREVEEDFLADLLVADVGGVDEPIVLYQDVEEKLGYLEYAASRLPGNYRIDDDSMTMFADVNAAWHDWDLHRFWLDGSRDVDFGEVCSFDCVSSPKWAFDKGRGVLYVNRPENVLQTVDVETGEVLHELAQGFSIGDIAGDFSGSLSSSSGINSLLWLSLPDLTPTYIKPLKEYSDSYLQYPILDVKCSPDGAWCRFESDVGGDNGELTGTRDRRIFVLDMKGL